MNKLQLETLRSLEEAMFNAELMMANAEGAIETLQTHLLREIDEKNFCSTPHERFEAGLSIARLRDRIIEERQKVTKAIQLRNAIARVMETITQ